MKYSTKLTALLLSGICLISGVALSATWQKVVTNTCTNIGDVCADGTIYVGDGLYMMRGSAPGESGYPGNYQWKTSATAESPTTLAGSPVNGKLNTYALCQGRPDPTISSITDDNNNCGSTYPAAQYCYNLSAHGYKDWYLPSLDEGNTLCQSPRTNGVPFGDAGYGPINYWLSTDLGNSNAYSIYSYALDRCLVTSGITSKITRYRVRCVRRNY